MALAMARPWKHPKTGIYWFRKRVPDELRARLGKTEEKQSLGTRDPAEAKIRQLEVLAAVEVRWANLKAGPRTLSEREAHVVDRNVQRVFMHALVPAQAMEAAPRPHLEQGSLRGRDEGEHVRVKAHVAGVLMDVDIHLLGPASLGPLRHPPAELGRPRAHREPLGGFMVERREQARGRGMIPDAHQPPGDRDVGSGRAARRNGGSSE